MLQGKKIISLQVLFFYLLVGTQVVCSTDPTYGDPSGVLIMRVYFQRITYLRGLFLVGTRKCPHNLNRPHFPSVFSYECPHKCAGVSARLCVYVFFWAGGGGGGYLDIQEGSGKERVSRF